MIKGNILEQLWGWKTPACTASLLVNWLYYVTLLDDPECGWVEVWEGFEREDSQVESSVALLQEKASLSI
jgi:hypothetical protein